MQVKRLKDLSKIINDLADNREKFVEENEQKKQLEEHFCIVCNKPTQQEDELCPSCRDFLRFSRH